MTPISFPQVTKVFTAPEGVSPEDCGSLPVHDTGQALVSCWQLTEEERAEVARTGVVWLWVFGRGTPPVAVEGRSPFDPPPAASDPEPQPGSLERCPATPDGRLPPDEISACEFCGGTAYCAGEAGAAYPPGLEPRVCLRVTVDDDDQETLCAEPYGERVDDPAKLTCEKCRRLAQVIQDVAHVDRPADSEQRIRQEVERLQGEDQGHG